MAPLSAEILRIHSASEPQEWENKIDLIRRTVAAGATHDELDLLLYQARRTGLDPLARQIHFIKRKGRGTVQVGIDGLRAIADRTGQYAGSDDAAFEGTHPHGYPSKATVTVHKIVQGQRCPFSATARWEEYYPGDDQGFQWRKMPHAMLAKCAEALALRKAFPAQLSGLYAHEEMEQADRPAPEARASEGRALEGRELMEATQRVFPEAITAPVPAVPEGVEAFGYTPQRWPLPRMFQDELTDSQRKMIAAKAAERGIAEPQIDAVRAAVLEGYGLEDEPQKAHASLFIDWLLHAGSEAVAAALEFADAEPFEETTSELELRA